MENLFLTAFNISITAGWLILAVIVVRFLFKRVPKKIFCFLWALVAVRLICPFSFESVFSLIPSTKTVTVDNNTARPDVQSGIAIVDRTINEYISTHYDEGVIAPVQPKSVNPMNIVAVVWMAGMGVLLIYALFSYLRLYSKVRASLLLQDNIYICDEIKSPFILGIIRPCIYVPSGMDERILENVCRHEKVHLKRHDHWWKPLGFLLLAVYWFHPLVWAAYILFCRDIEFACDERAIEDMSKENRAAYCQAMLDCSIPRRMVMACPLAFGEVGVKERVKSVLNYKKPTFWAILAALVICIVITICFLTNPEKTYQIRITVPAGSTAAMVYSEEEISPNRGSIRVSAGEGLGDTEVVLLPVEVTEENSYDEPVYLTPGMSVELEAEKGGWFKIGVSVQNPTDEDRDVYVSVKGVTVRIADTVVSPEGTESGHSDEKTENSDAEQSGEQDSEKSSDSVMYDMGDIDGNGDVDYIHENVAYELPDGLTESSYSAYIGLAGGCLFGPDAYEVYGEKDFAPAEWKAAGMIARFYTEDLLAWDGNQISEVYAYYNHTSWELLGSVDGLCAPAYLVKMNHDLYTVVYWAELMETADENGQITAENGKKIPVDDVESTSDYWYIYIARPGDEIGYVISLNAKNYTEEDIIAFAKTLKYLD